MTAINIRLCPVCRQTVKPTRARNIPAHLDSVLDDVCPGGGHPFHITIHVAPEQVPA